MVIAFKSLLQGTVGEREMHPRCARWRPTEIRGCLHETRRLKYAGRTIDAGRGCGARSRRARRTNERDARSQILSVGDLNKHGIFHPVTVYPPPPPSLRPSSFVLLPRVYPLACARAEKRRIIISSGLGVPTVSRNLPKSPRRAWACNSRGVKWK